LVFNGIDLQTGSHPGAGNHQHTGALGGVPAIAALYAAIRGDGLPMPWLADGRGIKRNMGIQSYTALPDENQMRQLANPNQRDTQRVFFNSGERAIVDRYRLERLQGMSARADNLPLTDHKLQQLYDARRGTALMDRLAAHMPAQLDSVDLKGESSGLVNRMHRVLTAIQAGVCVSASLTSDGSFDSHGGNDEQQSTMLTRTTRAVDYLWTKAEQMGVADRLVVFFSSDVGRRPYYNGNDGKDHFSNGASIIMMKNQAWTNRVVGVSGPTTNKVNINPTTLQEDANGVRLHPGQVHQTLRTILGIENHALSRQFRLDVPPIDALNPGVTSPVNV
jgi:hypothetical protein